MNIHSKNDLVTKRETCIYFTKVNDFISKLISGRCQMQRDIGLNDLNSILNGLIWVKQKDLHVQQYEFDFEFQYKVKKWKYHITISYYITKISVWSKKRSPEIAPQIMQYYALWNISIRQKSDKRDHPLAM